MPKKKSFSWVPLVVLAGVAVVGIWMMSRAPSVGKATQGDTSYPDVSGTNWVYERSITNQCLEWGRWLNTRPGENPWQNPANPDDDFVPGCSEYVNILVKIGADGQGGTADDIRVETCHVPNPCMSFQCDPWPEHDPAKECPVVCGDEKVSGTEECDPPGSACLAIDPVTKENVLGKCSEACGCEPLGISTPSEPEKPEGFFNVLTFHDDFCRGGCIYEEALPSGTKVKTQIVGKGGTEQTIDYVSPPYTVTVNGDCVPSIKECQDQWVDLERRARDICRQRLEGECMRFVNSWNSWQEFHSDVAGRATMVGVDLFLYDRPYLRWSCDSRCSLP